MAWDWLLKVCTDWSAIARGMNLTTLADCYCNGSESERPARPLKCRTSGTAGQHGWLHSMDVQLSLFPTHSSLQDKGMHETGGCSPKVHPTT